MSLLGYSPSMTILTLVSLFELHAIVELGQLLIPSHRLFVVYLQVSP